ncbi:MAG: glycosyltransferase family 4 protein, partial [Bacillota bacterium]
CKVIRTFVLPLESKGLLKRLLVFWSFMVSSLFAFPFVGKFDFVWAANPDVFVLPSAIIYGGLKRKSVIANVDDLLIEDLYDLGLVEKGSVVSRIAEFSARLLFAKVKAATVISPGYIPTIARYGIDKRNITVVRVGVDLTVFRRYPKCKTEGKFTVIYSGGFSIAYDFEQVFKAAQLLEEREPDIEFIIQGKGELVNSMVAAVKRLKINNVKIVDKLLSRSDVCRFLGAADVLILPLADFKTPYRGISSKLYEYQAVGKPIICCSKGGPKEYVDETSSGITVLPGDYEALAKAILFLKNNPEVACKMGKNGLSYVTRECSVDAIGSLIIRAYCDSMENQ